MRQTLLHTNRIRATGRRNGPDSGGHLRHHIRPSDTSTVFAAVVVVLVLVMGCLLQAGRLQRRQDGRATNAKLLDDADLLSEQSNGS